MQDHTGFVAAAYAISAIALLALVTWLALDARRQRRSIAELEAGGVRRRSDASS